MGSKPLEVRVLEPGQYPEWDAFVESSPQGTIFSSSLWATLVTQIAGLRHAIYAAFRGRELVGGTSVFYRSLGPLRIVVMPPLTRYTGLVVRDQSASPPMRRFTLEEQVFESLSARLVGDFHRVVLSLHPSLIDVRPAARLGWGQHCLYTYFSDLTDRERLWTSIDGEAKRQVARAQRLGIAVRESSDVGAFHALHIDTFRRRGLRPPIGEESTRALYDQLHELGRCKLFFAEDSAGQLFAAAFVVWDHRRAYYLMGAKDERLKASGAFSLVLWKMLERLADEVPEFDLFGANILTVARFKKDFATCLALYHDLKTYSFPLIERLDALRLSARRSGWKNWLPQARRSA